MLHRNRLTPKEQDILKHIEFEDEVIKLGNNCL